MNQKHVTLLLFIVFICTNLIAQGNQLNYTNFQTLEFSDESVEIDYSQLTANDYGLETYFETNSFEVKNIMFVNNDFSAIDERLNMEYPFKKRKHPLEKTGRILTYIGVPLAIIGGIMVAGADELYYECVNGNCSGDARGGFGVVMLGAGAGLAGTGTVLWIIGSKK